MSQLFSYSFIVLWLAATVRMSTSILFSSLGEIISERAGILNLGNEGTMLTGAFFGFYYTHQTGSLWLGVLAAVISGLFMGLLMGILTISLGTRQEVSGIALNLFSAGLTFFLFRVNYGASALPPHVTPFAIVEIPLLSKIPVLGDILFKQYALTYIALLLVPIIWYIIFKTNWGLIIRSVGENPRAADTVGINVYLTRYISLMAGSVLMAVGGAFISLAQFNMFLDQMIQGRGFIAIALTIFSNWDPKKALIGALIFGGADALQMRLQTMNIELHLPYQIFLMLPYVLTVIALLGVARKVEAPGSLIIPYKRGER
ncbi:MAG: ABC transporter permease [Halanaerobium sp.]|nr:ABC transporter permease [Halanaerobium sp.]